MDQSDKKTILIPLKKVHAISEENWLKFGFCDKKSNEHKRPTSYVKKTKMCVFWTTWYFCYHEITIKMVLLMKVNIYIYIYMCVSFIHPFNKSLFNCFVVSSIGNGM